MLTWWAGIYDHIFVAPHPFFRVRGFGGTDSEPEPTDDLIKSSGQMVSWREVYQAIAPDEPREKFDRAVWLLSVLGLTERADIRLQQRIKAHCEKEALYLPEEDGLPPILEGAVEEFLSALGAKRVTAWDEFRENSVDVDVSEFACGRPSIFLPKAITGNRVWALQLHNPKVLICWEFDGTVALVAMDHRALAIARPENFFDGWYADTTTYSDVFNPHDFFERLK